MLCFAKEIRDRVIHVEWFMWWDKSHGISHFVTGWMKKERIRDGWMMDTENECGVCWETHWIPICYISCQPVKKVSKGTFKEALSILRLITVTLAYYNLYFCLNLHQLKLWYRICRFLFISHFIFKRGTFKEAVSILRNHTNPNLLFALNFV